MRELLAANHVWLSGLFAAAVTTGLSWLIHSRLPRHVGKEDEGWRYVRPGAGYKLIMILLLPIVVFLDYAASQASEDQTAIAFVVAGTLTFGWLFACYDIFVKRIRFNAEEIQAIHPLWHRTIKWGPEVTGRYYQWLDMGCVRAADGRRIWLMPLVERRCWRDMEGRASGGVCWTMCCIFRPAVEQRRVKLSPLRLMTCGLMPICKASRRPVSKS